MDAERMHEECGLFGVFAPGEDVANLTYFGLYALQHRGQESAGIAVSNGLDILMHKEMGLVAQVFDNEVMGPLVGDIASGTLVTAPPGARAFQRPADAVRAQPARTGRAGP